MNPANSLPVSLTCEAFVESLWNEGFWDEMNADAYWSGEFNADKYFLALRQEAIRRNVLLLDCSDFDYDYSFWNLYRSDDDKGLS